MGLSPVDQVEKLYGTSDKSHSQWHKLCAQTQRQNLIITVLSPYEFMRLETATTVRMATLQMYVKI